MTLMQHTAYSCNIMTVEVETNAPEGGDGSDTTFELWDEASTSITVKKSTKGDGVLIVLRGDSECQTFIECLRFAADALNRQLLENASRRPKRLEDLRARVADRIERLEVESKDLRLTQEKVLAKNAYLLTEARAELTRIDERIVMSKAGA